MTVREINEAENLIKLVLKRNFLDDFCCGEDLELNLDLTLERLMNGRSRALAQLNSYWDDDKITDEQYTKTANAIELLYKYYKQIIKNKLNKLRNDDSDIENIDLPDYIDLNSPEATIYFTIYKKYRVNSMSKEKRKIFDREFHELYKNGELGDEEPLIDLPYYIDLDSPEAITYFILYKKYRVDEMDDEQREKFERAFQDQYMRIENYEKEHIDHIEGRRRRI